MNSGGPRFARAAVALVTGACVLISLAGPAAASATPYADPSANGAITLCDVQGQVATHGSIYTKPFVWRAVGSSPAPSAYRGAGRTATLFGYQPIAQVDPTLWSGQFLTGSARYSNRLRPMAGATAADLSLADYLRDYPVKWDGLVQLRMFLGAPQEPTLTTPYNAATIKVTGSTWTLLAGGTSGCATGTAASAELILPSVRALGTPAPNATTDGPRARGHGGASRGAATAGSSAGNGATAAASAGNIGAGSSSPPATDSAPDASAVAASGSTSHSGSSAVLWGVLLGVLVLLCAGAGALVWRGRRTG